MYHKPESKQVLESLMAKPYEQGVVKQEATVALWKIIGALLILLLVLANGYVWLIPK